MALEQLGPLGVILAPVVYIFLSVLALGNFKVARNGTRLASHVHLSLVSHTRQATGHRAS